MEEEISIYNKYARREERFYDETELLQAIFEVETELKLSFDKVQLELFEKLRAKDLALKKLENLHLIEFVLKFYKK